MGVSLDKSNEHEFFHELSLIKEYETLKTSKYQVKSNLHKMTELLEYNKNLWLNGSLNPYKGNCLAHLAKWIKRSDAQNSFEDWVISIKQASEKHKFPNEILDQVFSYINPDIVRRVSKEWNLRVDTHYQERLDTLAAILPENLSSLANKIHIVIRKHNQIKLDLKTKIDAVVTFRHIKYLTFCELKHYPRFRERIKASRIMLGKESAERLLAIIKLMNDTNLVNLFSGIEITKLKIFVDGWLKNYSHLLLPSEIEKLEENPSGQAIDKLKKLTTSTQAICHRHFLNNTHLEGNSLNLTNPLRELPSEIKFFSFLSYLTIDCKTLVSIPAEIRSLIFLERIDIHNTNLDSLPREIGQLTSLKVLDLENNKLTSVPKEMSKLTKLQQLILTFNQLTSLPDEMGKLTQLVILNLNCNRITSVPDCLNKLKNTMIDLHGNPIGFFNNLKFILSRNIQKKKIEQNFIPNNSA